MPSTKRGLIITSTMLLVAVLISACKQPYATPPAVTNTPIPQNLFATPMPGQPGNMSDVEKATTETAIAGVATQTPGGASAPGTVVTETPTPIVALNPTFTATQAIAVAPTSTSAPAGSKPATYTLQEGEFPFCIARRLNLDPNELLAINGLTSGDLYFAGQVLKIPQTGNPWPDGRALNPHSPSQIHTVTADQDTVYAVACYYGDVDPAAIAQANGISVGAMLTTGQQLKIP